MEWQKLMKKRRTSQQCEARWRARVKHGGEVGGAASGKRNVVNGRSCHETVGITRPALEQKTGTKMIAGEKKHLYIKSKQIRSGS